MAGEEPGKLNNFNLADFGVNVDTVQMHKEDGSFTKAQNAVADNLGNAKGIRKRPGLTKFNSIAGSGSIVGGIGVPLVLEASSVGGVALTGGPTRKIFWGRSTTSVNVGASVGWWTSTDAFATAAGTIGTGSIPEAPRASQISNFGTANLSLLTGGPNASVVYKNRLYYASNDYTRNSGQPLIRVFDGTIDQEFIRIPTNPAYGETQCQGILSMLLVGDFIYLTVYDNDGVSTAGSGRVFSLSPSTGALTPIGLVAFVDGYVPYCLAWHMGRLWCGTVFRTGTGSAGNIQWIRPGVDTSWTIDRTMSQGRGVGTLCSFQGQLFAGSLGTATTVIEVRSTLGVWSVSYTTANNETMSGAIVFLNNLYVNSWRNSGAVSLIKKFDGSSWSTAYTGANPFNVSLIDNNILFFGGGGDNFVAGLVTSPDGTTWTDRTANLTSHSGLSTIGALSF